MEQYIKKSDIVAEIRKRLLPVIRDKHYDEYEEGQDSERIAILEIIDTLEVKEIHEDIDVDLNSFFEELGVESDSRLASMLKKAFYEGFDKYLNKKENKT